MVKTRLTAEEFFALPLELGELVDGEVREERPPKPEHGRIALRIGYHLMRWLEETGRGVAGVEGGFVLRRDPDRVRSPDVWFLSHERLKEVTREGFYEGAPDLAVEVVSPGEEAEGVLAKVLDYLEAGGGFFAPTRFWKEERPYRASGCPWRPFSASKPGERTLGAPVAHYVGGLGRAFGLSSYYQSYK